MQSNTFPSHAKIADMKFSGGTDFDGYSVGLISHRVLKSFTSYLC